MSDPRRLENQPDAVHTLEVRLLGGFAVATDGRALGASAWPSLRAAHLVQVLSLAPQHRLLREQVIDALWPSLSAQAGAANLRKAAHHARRALGHPDGVRLQAGVVALWPQASVQVDSLLFELQARAALASHDTPACARLASQYGGDLLPSALYEDWSVLPRERLHSCFVALLRASGQWERLAQIEPTDEPAHQALMAAGLAAGQLATAIRWYAHLREGLQQKLCVLPNRETQRLYARCLSQLEPVGPPFVGREQLLAQLLALLHTPVAARVGAMVLRGPPGIGKSALCRELAVQAQQQAWCVLQLHASLAACSYAVTTALVERLLLGARSALEEVGEAARATLALLSPLAGPAVQLPGPLGRHQVIGAVRRLILAVAGGAEMLILIDDAQLLEDADADLLLQLASAGPPLCLLLALRPGAAGSALAQGLQRLAASGVLRVFELAPLADEETRRLVALAAPAPLAPLVLADIVRDARGNPFAAIELTRCWGAPGADRQLQPGVAQAIAARLCDVAPATLDALRWLALAGDIFDGASAVALLPGPEACALAALDTALSAGVLVLDGAQLRFRHALVRQALVEQIAPHRRLQMHRQAAQRLAALDAPAALVARHWLAAGCLRQAMPWQLAAARAALRLAAFADVLHQIEPLLAFQSTHAEALRMRAEALDAMGQPSAVAAYRRAAAASSAPEAPDLLAKAALAQIKQGDARGALAALVGVRPRSVEGLLCEALTYSGAAALGAIDPALGTQKSAEARRLALQSGDTAALVVASWAQAAAAHARGELHRSVWSDLQDTRDVPHLAMRVFDGQLCIAQRFLYGARPYAEVINFAQALASEAERIGAARGQAFGITLRGEAELLSGALAPAEQHLREGARLHRAIGAATGEAFSLQRLAEVALLRGQDEDARALLDAALDLARQTDVGFHLLDRIYGTRMQLAHSPGAALHALLEAQDSVRGPLETCPGCRITFAVPAALAAVRAQRLDLAEGYAEQTRYLAEVVMRLPAWHAAHEEVRGHVRLARGEGQAVAQQHFTAAAQGFGAAGQPLDAARCQRLVPTAPGASVA
jgi:DNA-binding SARP family transcriptional activator